jgi:hypothetical protein
MSTTDHRGVLEPIAIIIGAVIGACAVITAAAIPLFFNVAKVSLVTNATPTQSVGADALGVGSGLPVPQPTYTLLPTYTPYPTFTPIRVVVTPKPVIVTATPTLGAGTPLEQMTIIEGTLTRKSDTVIRGEKYPQALYCGDTMVVRLLQKYKTLMMKVAVDDKAGLGQARFNILDHNQKTLFADWIKAVLEPVVVEVDVSYAEYITMGPVSSIDDRPTSTFLRCIDGSFLPK